MGRCHGALGGSDQHQLAHQLGLVDVVDTKFLRIGKVAQGLGGQYGKAHTFFDQFQDGVEAINFQNDMGFGIDALHLGLYQ